MSTNKIRLPEDLKARVAVAAERAGTTSHSFILEAIAEKVDQEERRGKLNDAAEQRYRFSDYKEKVIDLLMRVTRVSVETQAIVEAMKVVAR